MSAPFQEQLLTWPGHYPRRTNPVGRRSPTRFPTVFELLESPIVTQAVDQAWNATQVGDTRLREHGGWIYMHTSTGQLAIRTTQAGTGSEIELGSPPVMQGMIVVGTFHTHPSSSAPGPSERDINNASSRRVPGIIRAPNGVYVYGHEARLGDSIAAPSSPGFPA